jgi:hypothetical protein
MQRSQLVQAAYHIWPLFEFDGRAIPYRDSAIELVLSTENARGGFGWGVHNTNAPQWSSACEDIDSIDPLARHGLRSALHREPAEQSLRRARKAVLENRNPDGGFVFMRQPPATEDKRPDWYPDENLSASAEASEMFSTWFRTLSIALIDTALGGSKASEWTFCQAPGMQFWGSPGRETGSLP